MHIFFLLSNLVLVNHRHHYLTPLGVYRHKSLYHRPQYLEIKPMVAYTTLQQHPVAV